MKIRLIRVLLSALFCLFAAPAFGAAETTEDYSSVFVRQEILHKDYKDIYKALTNIGLRESLESWYGLFFAEKENRRIYERTSRDLSRSILSRSYRDLMIYYAATGQTLALKHTVGLYFLSSATLLDNFAKDPQSQKWAQANNVNLASETFQKNWLNQLKNLEKCVVAVGPKSQKAFLPRMFETVLSRVQRACIFRNSWARTHLLDLKNLFHKKKFYGAPFPISLTGATAGNSVEVLSEVPADGVSTRLLGEKLAHFKAAIHTGSGQRYLDMTIEDFKAEMTSPEVALNTLFSADEGFVSADEHPSFVPVVNGKPGLFFEILSTVKNAKESVFIDVFWLGGSIGLEMAKTLMRKVIADPNFSVYFVSDIENKFTYGDELDTVYNYLRAFSEAFPDKKFYVAPAEVGLKRTALPEFIDLLATDFAIERLRSNEVFSNAFANDGFQLLAKSDHSKVIVVDGLDPIQGKAFVGSKNWTDSSGGIAIDEVAQIQGPAVPMILNSFYDDAWEAFSTDLRGGGVMTTARLAQREPKFVSLQRMLSGIDVLQRYQKVPMSDIRVEFPEVDSGDVIVKLAQNNVYGTEVSAVEQNIQAILGAKKQIIVDDQFLYDAGIFEALKVAKVVHGVDIYVMLHPLTSPLEDSKVGAHFPNNIFIPELRDLGIPVKWKILPDDVRQAVVDVFEATGNSLSPEFHLKSITVDGVLADNRGSCSQLAPEVGASGATPALITGSANKDVMTMSGGFREYQIMAFDNKSVAVHDCNFWQRWDDPLATEETDGLDFLLPPEASALGIDSNRDFLEKARQVIFGIYNFSKYSAFEAGNDEDRSSD